MKPFKLSLALCLPVALAAVAAPASAAPAHSRGPVQQAAWGHGSNGYGANGNWGLARSLRADLAQLDRRIDRAAAMRRLSPREASVLSRDVDRLEYQYAGFMRGGLTGWEARTLQQRIDRVERDLAIQMHDDDGRYGNRDDSRHDGRDDREWNDDDRPGYRR